MFWEDSVKREEVFIGLYGTIKGDFWDNVWLLDVLIHPPCDGVFPGGPEVV